MIIALSVAGIALVILHPPMPSAISLSNLYDIVINLMIIAIAIELGWRCE